MMMSENDPSSPSHSDNIRNSMPNRPSGNLSMRTKAVETYNQKYFENRKKRPQERRKRKRKEKEKNAR
jgi:hypothetical protein